MSFIKIIQGLLEQELPFFLLRKAGKNQLQLLHQNDQILHKTAHDKLTCASLNKFQNTDNQFFIYGEVNKKFSVETRSFSHQNHTVFENNTLEKQKLNHEKLVQKALDAIMDGVFKKVVLSRKREINGTFDPVKIIQNLLDAYPSNNCFFFFHPKIGSWAGATPEVLVSIKGNNVKTMSLAGTAFSQDIEGYIWRDKELEEQQIVTDSIAQNLAKSHVENIELDGPKTVASGQLLHLKTDINGVLSQDNLSEILDNLHPTPAVCGLPKEAARAFILQNEGYDRSYYTGYVGIQDGVESEFYVNLRSMEIKKNRVILYAGGGITHKSDPVDEFYETENKMNTMLHILPIDGDL